jgi:hypothetical protein
VKALAAVVMVAAGVVPGLAIPPGAIVARGGTRALGWTTAAEAAAATSAGALNVAYRDGFLTVYCANTALDQVFERVEAATGIPVVLEKQSVRKCRRTAIRRRPLEWALERLLTDHGFSYVLVLAPNDDIVTVRIFDTGERIQRAPPSPVRRIPGRLRHWPWIRWRPEGRR